MPCACIRFNHRAFSLIELLMVIAIVALLMSLVLPAAAAARKVARHTVCAGHMQQMGRAHHVYGHDFKDHIALPHGLGQMFQGSFTEAYSEVTSSQTALNIVREWDRSFIWPFQPYGQIPGYAIDDVIIYEQYSQLVLTSYLGGKQPLGVSVCPEDQSRLIWQRTPSTAMDKLALKPTKPRNINNVHWLPYSSSYQLVPTAWTYDRVSKPTIMLCGTAIQQHFYQSDKAHDMYYRNPGVVNGRKLSEVAFPSQKVSLADSQQRHLGKLDQYYAYTDSRQPLLFFDGAVHTRRTGDANKGWDLRHYPSVDEPTVVTYDPDAAFESPIPLGQTGTVTGYYKWTRGGLGGIDYGGLPPRVNIGNGGGTERH